MDLIGTYVIRREEKKEYLNIKDDTMINPVTGWFEITKWDDKCMISIVNLVETVWFYRYPQPTEIKHDQ